MHFSLRQMKVFDAIARLGSVSRAAEEVALSQSAASMALKDLEDSIGSKLFHRHGRALVLNENGRRLQPKARSLIVMAAEIGKSRTGELEGELRIAASTTVGNYVVPKCGAAFLSQYPKVRLNVATTSILDAISRVEAMSVDLGLLETPCSRNTLLSEALGHDRAVVFAAPAHPLAHQDQVSFEQLRSESWCLRAFPSLTLARLASSLGGAGLNIRFMADTNEAIKAAVAAGVGLGFASTRVIAHELAKGELVVIAADAIALERELTLITPKNVYQGVLPRAFADHLRAWFAAEGAQP
jgi:DNA-binding transcriptional LysR family regulator